MHDFLSSFYHLFLVFLGKTNVIRAGASTAQNRNRKDFDREWDGMGDIREREIWIDNF